ncbi:hypothetical protein NKH99_25370 [Mesorhizobium sp. M0854]|uniref:hypothetical protein n=1 Tax=Mesorhizobium sp. M0854 TaxID=2957013 RepID=UPI0033397B03
MRIAADTAGMIVVLENGCGDRGKAIGATPKVGYLKANVVYLRRRPRYVPER